MYVYFNSVLLTYHSDLVEEVACFLRGQWCKIFGDGSFNYFCCFILCSIVSMLNQHCKHDLEVRLHCMALEMNQLPHPGIPIVSTDYNLCTTVFSVGWVLYRLSRHLTLSALFFFRATFKLDSNLFFLGTTKLIQLYFDKTRGKHIFIICTESCHWYIANMSKACCISTAIHSDIS